MNTSNSFKIFTVYCTFMRYCTLAAVSTAQIFFFQIFRALRIEKYLTDFRRNRKKWYVKVIFYQLKLLFFQSSTYRLTYLILNRIVLPPTHVRKDLLGSNQNGTAILSKNSFYIIIRLICVYFDIALTEFKFRSITTRSKVADNWWIWYYDLYWVVWGYKIEYNIIIWPNS